MASAVNGEIWERAVWALSEFGPWPLAICIVLVTFVVYLPSIIPAMAAAWKVKKETTQKLAHKQHEFENKIIRKVPDTKQPNRLPSSSDKRNTRR